MELVIIGMLVTVGGAGRGRMPVREPWKYHDETTIARIGCMHVPSAIRICLALHITSVADPLAPCGAVVSLYIPPATTGEGITIATRDVTWRLAYRVKPVSKLVWRWFY